MKRRRHQHVSKEDGLTLSQRNTLLKKKKTSTTGRHDNSESIPVDLIIEILWRLPLKSIARCRCVSKLWASTLRLPCFTELYLTRSSSRPQLFFSSHNPGALDLFSAPQVQNPSLVTANYHMKFPFNDSYGNAGSFDHLRGLTCHTNVWDSKGWKEKEMVSIIYNPSTRECLNLPKLKTINNFVRSFLGYNPSTNQFKVLCVTWGYCKRLHRFFEDCQVLTLGKINRWRRIECSVPHHPMGKPICVDGGLYYLASLANDDDDDKVVWFGVRYEKFKFINAVKNNPYYSALVNFKGKLGLFLWDTNRVTRGSKLFELWVLVDAEKQEWSKQVFVLPSLWKNVVAKNDRLIFVGVIAGTNEIVLAPEFRSCYGHFNVYYYDFESETITRVGVEGIYAETNSSCRIVETFLDHLEDVKLLKMF